MRIINLALQKKKENNLKSIETELKRRKTKELEPKKIKSLKTIEKFEEIKKYL